MYLLTWGFLCLTISFTCAKLIVPLPPVLVAKVLPIEEQCIKESGSAPNSLRLMLAWKTPHDLPSKKFLHCFLTRTGYLDQNGHIVVDKFLILMKDSIDDATKETFTAGISKCNELNAGDDMVAFVYEMAECFHKYADISFTLDPIGTR